MSKYDMQRKAMEKGIRLTASDEQLDKSRELLGKLSEKIKSIPL